MSKEARLPRGVGEEGAIVGPGEDVFVVVDVVLYPVHHSVEVVLVLYRHCDCFVRAEVEATLLRQIPQRQQRLGCLLTLRPIPVIGEEYLLLHLLVPVLQSVQHFPALLHLQLVSVRP